LRSGIGIDIHKLSNSNFMILGGVKIDCELGIDGHSDGDVLIHSIIDALLGAASLGDIGAYFPSNDPKYKGISSIKLLEIIMVELDKYNWNTNNIDATIILEKPKLNPYIFNMREILSEVIGINIDQINIKSTTADGIGLVGKNEGICCIAIASINKIDEII
tara:strand:+ start:11211 stop:11696 length:486 start_codon:yes stop_codon:yes gene_type:complete